MAANSRCTGHEPLLSCAPRSILHRAAVHAGEPQDVRRLETHEPEPSTANRRDHGRHNHSLHLARHRRALRCSLSLPPTDEKVGEILDCACARNVRGVRRAVRFFICVSASSPRQALDSGPSRSQLSNRCCGRHRSRPSRNTCVAFGGHRAEVRRA
jgi:hypothetical protein